MIDIAPLFHELLELNPHVPSAPPPDAIQILVELHDSHLKVIGATSLVLDAYVHRWMRHGIQWVGSGWLQPMRLAFHTEVVFSSLRLPATLSGGRLIVAGTTYDNCIPYPMLDAGPAQLVLEIPNHRALELYGDRLEILACGEARFLEALPSEFAPIDAG